MFGSIATVSGRLVSLRPISREDYLALFTWRSSLETVHMLNFRRRIATFEEFVRHLETLLPNTMLMLIQARRDGTPIGYALAHTINPWDGWLGVGMYVVPEYRYRGHGAEAAVLALDAIFHWFPVRKVMTEIYSFAQAQLQLARAMGFEDAGVVRELYWYRDRCWDGHYMWLTRERWLEGREHLLAIAGVQNAYHGAADQAQPPSPSAHSGALRSSTATVPGPTRSGALQGSTATVPGPTRSGALQDGRDGPPPPTLAALVIATAAALAVWASLWLLDGSGPGSGSGQAVAQQEHRWTLADARAFTGFPLYWVGEEYKGLRLDEVKRVQGRPPPGKFGYPQDFVAFLYDDGRCQPTPGPWMSQRDSGWSCALPLDIQIHRACLYPPGLLGSQSIEKLSQRRGALVLDEPERGQLRVWSGDVAIFIYVNTEGVTPAQVFDDLMAMQPSGPGPSQPLPAGPAKESVTPLDDNQVFLAGGTCQ